MPSLETTFDETSGRITWRTVDDQGDRFLMSLGPDATDPSKFHIHIELPDGTTYDRTFNLN